MSQKQKGIRNFFVIRVVLLILAVVGGTSYLLLNKKQVVCTMEAKICPDGSAVGRTGPNCEFAKCPEGNIDETAGWKTYTSDRYGFEVKYPAGFTPTIDAHSKELIWLEPDSQPDFNLEPFIAVGQERYTLLFQGTWSPIPYSQAGTAKIISSEQVTINDIIFNKDLWFIRPGIDNVISYNASHNGKYYTIYSAITSPNDEADLSKTVSTFEFIDTTGSAVKIFTDKDNYEQGEIVNITVQNNLDKSIGYYDYSGQYSPQFAIQIFNDGIWEDVAYKSVCACRDSCTTYANGWMLLDSGATITDGTIWDTKEDCLGIVVKNGRYRTCFPYSTDTASQEQFLETCSNEFVINAEDKPFDKIDDESEEMVVAKINYPEKFNGLLMKLHIEDDKMSALSKPAVVNGYPNYFSGSYKFVAQVVFSNNSMLGEYGFNDPRIILAEQGYQGPTWLESTDFNLIIPYFEAAQKINIYSSDGLVFSINVSDLITE
jgi:hypothetical protein